METTAELREPGAAQLRALVEQAPEGVFVADTDGRYTYVNEAGCRMLGYAREELVGKTILDLIPAQDAERLAHSKAQMLRGASHTAEWILRRKDGGWMPVEVSASILPDGQWQGFVRDISERKAHETEREAHETEREALFREVDAERRWLRAVLDTVPVGVMLYQPGRGLSFNAAAETILGMRLSPGVDSSQYAARVFYPDGRPVPPASLPSARALARGETLVGGEFVVRHEDGKQVHVLSTAAPIIDAHGKVGGTVCLLQDIGERIEAEARVERERRLLQSIFDLLPVGLWIADRDGRITMANPAGERIWQGTRYVGPEQFGEYKAWWVETGEPIAPDEWGVARAVRKGETSRGELVRIQCFDGSFKTVINWAAPIRSGTGEITGAIAVNEDVTALQQTQEQLRQAVRDREEILAMVAHDLRNPLSGIIMSAFTAARAASRLPGGEQVSALAASLADIARGMSGMVDDLLAVAVASLGGTSMLKLTPASASGLVERAADAARPRLAKQGLALEASVAGGLPGVNVDADRILRVFANLLDNALKFTSAPGCVTIAAEPTAGGVRFSVANSGEALLPAEREAMFQPFWQAGRDRRGAGLGLSICRSIVEAHGGTIWAEPAAGQRVRVCFVLPLQPRAGAAASL